MPFSQLPTARSQSAPRRAPTTACSRSGFAYGPSGAYTRARTRSPPTSMRFERFSRCVARRGATLSLPRPDETLGDAAEALGRHPQDSRGSCLSGAVWRASPCRGATARISLGGYHLVWPRDATLTALALAGCEPDASMPVTVLFAFNRGAAARGTLPQNYFPSGDVLERHQLDEGPCPCCSPPSGPSSASRSCRARLRWCARRSASSPAPDPPVPRTAGRRIPG